jgi:hypothetical protein
MVYLEAKLRKNPEGSAYSKFEEAGGSGCAGDVELMSDEQRKSREP